MTDFQANYAIKNCALNLSDLLNKHWTVLFVMIGLRVMSSPYLSKYTWITLGTICLVILARWLSILLPFQLARQPQGSLRILTWAGLRGGISIALALSLANSAYKELILVLFQFRFSGRHRPSDAPRNKRI